MDNPGVASLPGFDASLRHLLVEEKFTMQDVGEMFGVSPERIRQLKDRLGIEITVKGRGKRRWDDTLNKFIPVDKYWLQAERAAKLKALTAFRRQKYQELISGRRKAVVETIKNLAQELRREPTWHEMACAVGLDTKTLHPARHAIYVLNMFGWIGRKPNAAQGADTVGTLKAFRELTGTRGRGRHVDGHIKWFETPKRCV